ncbi:MAG: M24 family metallopeptidase [Armatimonadetes bacterium]|nr:M24 family metallopeptidase [Armatimonadota bacterium]
MNTLLQKPQIDRLRDAMAEAEFDAILVSSTTNLFWLTGFTGSFGYVVLTPTEARFITDSRYTVQAQEQVTNMPVVSFSSPKTGMGVLAENLEEMGIQKLGFESPYVTYAQYLTYQEKISGVEWVPAGDLIENLRMIKSPAEVEKIKAACALTDKCFDHIKRLVQVGVSEFEIQLELEFFFRRNGATCAFDPIIVSGANSARPHGKATEKPLAEGDLVTFDFGAKIAGYCADMTRTVVVGKASDRTRDIYGTVLRAQLACLDMMKPGVVAGDVDAKAREVFGEMGWAENFGHGLGHGLGILVHDTGRLGVGSKTVLEPGQIWTVEPGIYFEGFGGCRIEDDVLITETGIEIFNHSTKDMLELS